MIVLILRFGNDLVCAQRTLLTHPHSPKAHETGYDIPEAYHAAAQNARF